MSKFASFTEARTCAVYFTINTVNLVLLIHNHPVLLAFVADCFLILFSMALPLQFLLVLFASFLRLQSPAYAATCSDCFTHSRAAYYPNSDEKGTESE